MDHSTQVPPDKISTEIAKPGFFYGYVIVSVGFLILTAAFGAQATFGVFFKPILSEFGWTRAVTSGAYSVNMIISGFAGILAGRLSDKIGPRPVITACGLLAGLGYLLMPYIQSTWQIYLFYGVFTCFGPTIWVPLLSTVVRWFSNRRGLMSGIVAAGIGAGSMVMPPVANQLIANYGWRTSYTIIGSIVLVVAVIGAQFLRSDPGHPQKLVADVNQLNSKDSNLGKQGYSLKAASRTWPFWMINLIFFFVGFCLQIVMVHIVPHATDLGISAAIAAGILSVVGAATIAGRIGLGSFGDRIGNRNIAIVGFALNFLAFVWLLFAYQPWMFYLFGVFIAVGYGGLVTVQSPLVADFFGLRAHGVILGIVNLGFGIGGTISPLIAGHIYDISSSYFSAFVLCVVLSAAGILTSVLLKSSFRPGPNLASTPKT